MGDGEETWRIRGPFDQKSAPFFEYIRAERDAYVARHIMTMRERPRASRAVRRFWCISWNIYDVMLPRRWQVNHDVLGVMSLFLAMPMRELKAICSRYMHEAARRKALLNMPAAGKDEYHFADVTMKPLLASYGYRSLAQFERAWEEAGGNPPWPRQPGRAS